MKLAYELLADITDAYVAGDKAYDAAPLVELLEGHRCIVAIPSKSDRAGQRKIDLHISSSASSIASSGFAASRCASKSSLATSSRSSTWRAPWCGWSEGRPPALPQSRA
jgi:hypothetical protein